MMSEVRTHARVTGRVDEKKELNFDRLSISANWCFRRRYST